MFKISTVNIVKNHIEYYNHDWNSSNNKCSKISTMIILEIYIKYCNHDWNSLNNKRNWKYENANYQTSETDNIQWNKNIWT